MCEETVHTATKSEVKKSVPTLEGVKKRNLLAQLAEIEGKNSLAGFDIDVNTQEKQMELKAGAEEALKHSKKLDDPIDESDEALLSKAQQNIIDIPDEPSHPAGDKFLFPKVNPSMSQPPQYSC